MPNVISHYLFAKEIQKSAPKDSFLRGNFDFLALGAQGPDILFFTGYGPWDIHPKLRKGDYGNQLHDENGEVFFSQLCAQLKRIEDPAEARSFKAFVYGCLTHLILDRTTHPFTYYFTGFDENHLVRHSMIESAYGSNQARLMKEPHLIEHPLVALPYKKDVNRIIDENLGPVLRAIYGVDFPKRHYKHALRTYRFVLKLVNNPLTSLLTGGRVKQLRMKPDSSDRCLNLQRKPWRIPYSGEERTNSFLDLFEAALVRCRKALADVEEKGMSLESIKPYLNELNYEGYPVGGKMVYSAPDHDRTDW